jgi:hypothetical protein
VTDHGVPAGRLARLRALAPADCPLLALLDARLLAAGAAWGIVALLVFGWVSAILPNPVFGRQVPPEPFAIAVWLAAAPLMGLVMATYTMPVRSASPAPIRMLDADPAAAGKGSTLGTLGSLGAFLAIGCPVCNKIALVLLGASGAMSVWAPIQPLVGGASLVLLVVTLAWRLRLRARGGACAVPA